MLLTRKWMLLWILIGINIIAAIYLYLVYVIWLEVSGHAWYQRHHHYISKTKQLLGKTEKDVVKALGPPTHVIHKWQVEKGIVKYPVEGYAKPQRSITNKVMIYIKGDAIFYIYINHKGYVEDIFYGPS